MCSFLHKIRAFLAVVAAGMLVTSGIAQTPTQAELVHFGDLIEVDVVGSYEYDWRGSLTPEGFLDGLDMIPEQIYALCKTEGDLAAAIRTEYAKTLNNPRVEVRILDRSNRAVAFLTGAVRTPQRLQIKRPVHLNEALILSGGITDRSSGEVSIFRPANMSCVEQKNTSPDGQFLLASQPRGVETITIKIVDILRGEKSANPLIFSGDIVTVSEALPVYVIGGVNAPQQLAIRNQVTLSRAISMAGGLAKEGNSEITIFRREGRESRIIQADLRKIAAGQAEDPVLKPFDIIDVPQKGKPSRTRPPVVDGGVSKSLAMSRLPLRIID